MRECFGCRRPFVGRRTARYILSVDDRAARAEFCKDCTERLDQAIDGYVAGGHGRGKTAWNSRRAAAVVQSGRLPYDVWASYADPLAVLEALHRKSP